MKERQDLAQHILKYIEKRHNKNFVIIISAPNNEKKTKLNEELLSFITDLPIISEEIPGIYMRDQLVNIVTTNYTQDNTVLPAIVVSQHNPLLEGDQIYLVVLSIN